MQPKINESKNQAQIKDKIFTSAQKLFVQKGYHNTSIPDIVREAGVSTGAIYHYFSGKEDLARYIHQETLEYFLTKFVINVKPKKNTKDKIYAYTKLLYEWTEENPIMVEYLLKGRPKEILNQNMSICSKEGMDAVIEIVDAGCEEGVIDPANKIVATASISGIITKIIFMRFDGVITFPLTDIIEETTATIRLGISKVNNSNL